MPFFRCLPICEMHQLLCFTTSYAGACIAPYHEAAKGVSGVLSACAYVTYAQECSWLSMWELVYLIPVDINCQCCVSAWMSIL